MTNGTRRPPDRVVDLSAISDRDLVDGWRTLALETGASYFTSPDWALTWLETIGRGRTGRLAVWTAGDGAVEAVAGLTAHRERLHSRLPFEVTGWANLASGPGSADHLRFPARPERIADVAAWVAESAGRRSVLLRSLPPGAWAELGITGGVLIEERPCPVMALDPDPVPAAFRKKLRYYRRRTAAEGITYESIGPGALDGRLLDALFDLHEARWALKPEASSSHLRDRKEFFLGLVERGEGERGPVAIVAQQGGRIVGLLLGFVFGSTFSYFQNGWEPELRNLSIGTVLVDLAVEYAVELGCTTFDFLRGTTDYKYRFGGEDSIDETWLLPRGLGGRLLAWKYTSGRDVARRGVLTPGPA